jgi:hypothetical protein
MAAAARRAFFINYLLTCTARPEEGRAKLV